MMLPCKTCPHWHTGEGCRHPEPRRPHPDARVGDDTSTVERWRWFYEVAVQPDTGGPMAGAWLPDLGALIPCPGPSLV